MWHVHEFAKLVINQDEMHHRLYRAVLNELQASEPWHTFTHVKMRPRPACHCVACTQHKGMYPVPGIYIYLAPVCAAAIPLLALRTSSVFKPDSCVPCLAES